ncbi:peptidylprolyl isomerase [Terriglobus sp. RCC_193]|uniref:peptidylprolyl isomerase n=1 Tax=Terriglobus sp. RCC_193 TaxID=3239218 RepID=UPI003524E01A
MAVRVNGEVIHDERFHREFVELSGGRTPQQVQEQAPMEYHRLLQTAERNTLRSVLLHQVAVAEGITATAEEAEEERRSTWGSAANQSCGIGITSDMISRLMVKKVQQHLTRHVQRPDRREVEAIYRNNSAAFTIQERWLVSHIVQIAETEAEHAKAINVLKQAQSELKRSKSFAAVADRYSDCKGNGGSLGWINRGTMVPEFEAKVFTLERRKLSDIFETTFGLHLAILHDWKPAGLQPLDEVRADLARHIFEERKQVLLNQITEDLMRRAEIAMLPDPERSVAAGEKVQ